MYRIAICDDEKIFNESAKVLLENIALQNRIEISVESYLNANILLSDLENGHKYFDLILFDVIIGDENGINIACKIKQNYTDIKFIFMTAYPEYAIDGYEAEPSGFLIKPLNEVKLKRAFLRAFQNYKLQNLIIKENGKSYSINLKSIIYIEIYGKTLTFHLKDNKTLEFTKTLSEIIQLLPKDNFIQCHRSFLVAINEIKSIVRYEILLSGGMKIPVSKLRYTDVQKALIESVAATNL